MATAATRTARPPLPRTLLAHTIARPTAAARPSFLAFCTQPQPLPSPAQQQQQHGGQRRAFLTALTGASSDTPQVLTARARLPYHHAAVYERIADIDAYASFLPYCTAARVTAWTAPLPYPYADAQQPAGDTQGGEGTRRRTRRWPTRADLTVGWGGIQETYTSRVFCAPVIASGGDDGRRTSGIVEAVSGADGRTELSDEDLARWGLSREDPASSPYSAFSSSDGIFKSLVTRWTVTDATPSSGGDGGDGRFQTDVRLDLKFRFANPLYAAVSSTVADRLAPIMVDAFVKQAARVLAASGRRSPGGEKGGSP